MLKKITVDNALFIPGGWSNAGRHDFLCDEQGNVVRVSCQIRGPSPVISGEQNVTDPDVTRIADAARSAPLLKGEYMFLGRVDINHFGHAVTEGLARLWALQITNNKTLRIPVGISPFGLVRILKILYYRNGRDGWRYILAALKAYGLSRKNFLVTREPVRLERIVVPEPSAVLRQRFFPEHLETARKVSEHFLPRLSNHRSHVPVYLSRSKPKKSTSMIRNEIEVERFMAKTFDAKIIWPERLTASEKIKVFNEHNVFVGMVGSAFHNFLFRRTSGPVTAIYLTKKGEWYRSYSEIDRLVGVDGHYVACCEATHTSREFECDIEMAKAAIISILNGIPELLGARRSA